MSIEKVIQQKLEIASKYLNESSESYDAGCIELKEALETINNFINNKSKFTSTKSFNKTALCNDLTEAFIEYQYNIDHPMPIPVKSFEEKLQHYRSNNIFHHKVDNLVAGIMFIFIKHIGDI